MQVKSWLSYPDLILFNGKIRTFASVDTVVEALVCAGGRIVAIGSSDEVRKLSGSDTRMVNLEVRTAIPGLTDAHVHLADKGTAERNS